MGWPVFPVYQGTECLPGSEVSTRDYQGLPGLSGDTRAIRGYHDIYSGSEKKFSDREIVEDQIEKLIQRTLPTEPGHRHRNLFNLARGLKFMPELADKPIDELRLIVKTWHERALPVIVNCRDFEEEWWDFRESYESATKPLEGGFMSLIRQRASEANMPKLAEEYENHDVRELITICREAQREVGDKVFFLSSVAVAEMFDIEQRRAHRWLKGLCADGILELVESGKQARKANTYRYLGPLED